MSPDASELFHQLVDLSPEERARYLAAHPVDPATLREVEELLAYDAPTAHFAQPIAAAAGRALQSLDAQGMRCGAFRLMSVIGRGGMGVVYLAERVDGEVTQRAAVKLMQPGWSEVQRDRFLQEREILAGLSHPNVAHLLDAGHLADGQPYLAMEYVEGEPIDAYCRNLTLRGKVELFLKVCGAVSYLHSNLVVHRDLKPSNILIPASGEPKLLDFGIAKLLDFARDATVTQMRMLTPSYASPEQLSGATVRPVSDVFSLGAVLHCILTGKPPQESPEPLTSPELKGDLEMILRKALRPEPKERYSSAAALAADLRAWLEERPIRARQGDRLYRVRTFVRRHWLKTALAAAVTTTLVSAGLLARYWLKPSPPGDLKPERLTSNTPELPIQAAALSPAGDSVAYSDPLGVHIRPELGGATRLLPGTEGHVLMGWSPDGARLHTRVLRADGNEVDMMVPAGGGAPAIAKPLVSSSDSRAVISEDRHRLTLPAGDGSVARDIWRAGPGINLDDYAFAPDNKHIAVLSSNTTASMVEIVRLPAGSKQVLISLAQNKIISSIVWPAGNRLIVAVSEYVAANTHNTNLWDIAFPSGRMGKLTNWTDFPIRAGSLSTDGRSLAFVRSFRQRDVYVADLDPGNVRMSQPRRLTLDLGDDYPTAWTLDSKAVILASDRNGKMSIFRQGLDQQTAEPLAPWAGSQIIPRVSSDGTSLLFWSWDPAKSNHRLVRAPMAGGTPEVLHTITDLMGFRCSQAGRCIVAERYEKGTAVFEMDLVRGKGPLIFRDPDTGNTSPDLSPDGKWLALPVRNKIVLRAFDTGQVVREIAVPGTATLTTLDFAPDGKGVFSGDYSATQARLFYVDFKGATSLLWRQAGGSFLWGVPSPDGRHLALMLYTDDSNVYAIRKF